MTRLALGTVFLIVASIPAGGEEFPRKIKPVLVWTGTDSDQDKELFACCRTQAEWKDVWAKHRGPTEPLVGPFPPEIDFDRFIALAVFKGPGVNDSGIGINSVSEESDSVRLRYRPSTFQTAGPRSYRTRSFVFLVLPKTQKTIVLEEDVRGVIGAPPVWKERARFAANAE